MAKKYKIRTTDDYVKARLAAAELADVVLGLTLVNSNIDKQDTESVSDGALHVDLLIDSWSEYMSLMDEYCSEP